MIIRFEDLKVARFFSSVVLYIFFSNQILWVITLIPFTSSCKAGKTNHATAKNKTDNEIPQSEGLELILNERDGDIMEFDVSRNSNLLAYSTNAYRNAFQVFLMDFKRNKKQYVMPEDVEQRSPTINENNLYFVRIDKGVSYITHYDIKQNVAKTLFKINNLVLKLTSGNQSNGKGFSKLSFALNDKGLWKIWLFDDNKFIFVDDGFAPFISGDYIYFQKPNLKGSSFYSIYAFDTSSGAKYSIVSDSNRSYINPSANQTTNLIAFVEFYENTYFLKLMDLKSRNSYTLLKSPASILSPNLNVDGYVYFIWQKDDKFAIYRKKIQ